MGDAKGFYDWTALRAAALSGRLKIEKLYADPCSDLQIVTDSCSSVALQIAERSNFGVFAQCHAKNDKLKQQRNPTISRKRTLYQAANKIQNFHQFKQKFPANRFQGM